MLVVLSILSVLLILNGCGKKSAEEMSRMADTTYAAAQKDADSIRAFTPNIKQHFAPSLEAFEKLVTEYPKSPEAERALIKMAQIRMNDTREPDLALVMYKKYVTTYPDGQFAPLSMFMVGYIYNNEIHNNDSAKVAYQRFLDKYPQNENAAGAQFELQNIGKSPEELLPPIDEEGQGSEEVAKQPEPKAGSHKM
jgi:outer membrane protein assembly factor BamD (BamD/ComL family)